MKWETIVTSNGILAVANFVHNRDKTAKSLLTMGNREVAGYSVYLPTYPTLSDLHYAEYLLDHPHAKVRCNFAKEDLILR